MNWSTERNCIGAERRLVITSVRDNQYTSSMRMIHILKEGMWGRRTKRMKTIQALSALLWYASDICIYMKMKLVN